jgi:hypothetical protein
MISRRIVVLAFVTLVFLLPIACSGSETPKRLDIEVERVEFRDSISQTVADGVFAVIQLNMHNITDSPLNLGIFDFTLIDEKGKAHKQSTVGLKAWARSYRYTVSEDYQLGAGMITPAFVIFDIQPTGQQRRLSIRFKDEPAVEFDAIPE